MQPFGKRSLRRTTVRLYPRSSLISSAAVIVLEDDNEPYNDFERIEYFIKSTQGDTCQVVDMLDLHIHGNRGHYMEDDYYPDFLRHNGPHLGTGGYYITNYAARVLLKHAFPIDMHVDAYIGEVVCILQLIGSLISN
jgi:GR25 family glycosyltransferase involved in LPS biosynthesis